MPILALLLAAAAPADTAIDPHLQPLSFLVGSCWRAPLPHGLGTDTHCFTSMLGHFVRDRHALSPVAYSGETLYRWDAAGQRIRFDYYSSEGLLMSGTSSAIEHGLSFEMSTVSPDGGPAAMRATWRRDGADAYVVATEVRQNDAWVPAPGNPRFQRVGPAPPD